MLKGRYRPELTPLLGSPSEVLVLCALVERARRYIKDNRKDFWTCLSPPAVSVGETEEAYLKRVSRRYTYPRDSLCEATGLPKRTVGRVLSDLVSASEEEARLCTERASTETDPVRKARLLLKGGLVYKVGCRKTLVFSPDLSLIERGMLLLSREADRLWKIRFAPDRKTAADASILEEEGSLFLSGAFWGGDVGGLVDQVEAYVLHQRPDVPITPSEVREAIQYVLMKEQLVLYGSARKDMTAWDGHAVYRTLLKFFYVRYAKDSPLKIDFLRYDHYVSVICAYLGLNYIRPLRDKAKMRQEYERLKEMSYRLEQADMDLVSYLRLLRGDASRSGLLLSMELVTSPKVISRILSNRQTLAEQTEDFE